MSILQNIDRDFTEAMKAKQEVALSTLRMIRTALKNKQIELQHELSEAEAVGVLKTMLKQYQDALQDFMTASRQDLVDRQQKEIDLLSRYLPPSLSAEELERIVSEALKTSEIKEVGRAMGVAMKAVAGRADGTEVRKIVEKILGI